MEIKQCEKCNNQHTGDYGSGRFCSNSCANSRTWSEKSKKKRGEKLKQYIAENPSWKENQLKQKSKMINSLKKTLYNKNRVKFDKGNMNDRTTIKKWLIETKKEICSICGIGPEWNNSYLSLQVDHINGINNDNRPENLRLVCPNCHSQTDTFAGKKLKVLVV